MYKKVKITRSELKVNESREGETMEQKVQRIVEQKEPIKDGAPLIYTERKDGVQAGYNIRTDRFEIAVEAMDKVTKSQIAKRSGVVKLQPKIEENNSGAESVESTK